MSKEVKEDIIFYGKLFLVILVLVGIITKVACMATSSQEKEENTLYTKIQSFEYIIIDGISIKTSEIQSFEDNWGENYKSYTFVLEDGTEIETGSYILTNRRNLK